MLSVLALAIIPVYYGLQYAATAVHYNCNILKDDCVPPIYWPNEFIYRILVQPPWLDKFEYTPIVFSFSDGRFSLWEGEVGGKPVVIRVSENSSPVIQWIFKEGLPGGIDIHPASGDHIQEWIKTHPEYE